MMVGGKRFCRGGSGNADARSGAAATRAVLSDAQWARIVEVLPRKPGKARGREAGYRRFVEAILFVARRRCPWRELPAEFGKWNSVYVRFVRWEAQGVWRRIAEVLDGEAGLAGLFVEAAKARAQQEADAASRIKWRSGERPLAGLSA